MSVLRRATLALLALSIALGACGGGPGYQPGSSGAPAAPSYAP